MSIHVDEPAAGKVILIELTADILCLGVAGAENL